LADVSSQIEKPSKENYEHFFRILDLPIDRNTQPIAIAQIRNCLPAFFMIEQA
jgi:hypothetical protein